MEDLPELPFEQIMSYLSVEEMIKSRAVCRAWYHRVNSFRVKSLCFSEGYNGPLQGKPRLINGSYVHNFILSTRFASFFHTFRQTILSNLRHLRLTYVTLKAKSRPVFIRSLNSFDQLEELEIFRFRYHPNPDREKVVELKLSMLHSIHLEKIRGTRRLTLDAPKLKRIELLRCHKLKLNIVHAESVKMLLIDELRYTPVKKLKSLEQLYIQDEPVIDRELLSGLEQLQEVHLFYPDRSPKISEFFDQKQRHGHVDLKIYFRGLLLEGANDREIGSLDERFMNYTLAERNSSRLADEIPFRDYVLYVTIESVALTKKINYLKRFTTLKRIYVSRESAENVQGFLDFLKNLDTVSELHFFHVVQQELFDRLHENAVIQWLAIDGAPADFQFFFHHKNLVYLHLDCTVDPKIVRKLLKRLQFLWMFEFKFEGKRIIIKTVKKRTLNGQPKQFEVSVYKNSREFVRSRSLAKFKPEDSIVADLKTVMKFILKLRRGNEIYYPLKQLTVA